MRWVSRLTTIAIITIVVAGVALWIRSRMPQAEIHGSFPTHARFRDGSRLAMGSPVVIAGVRIGDITRVSIEGSFARVDMTLRADLEIPFNSFITRRADSLFGDSYLEIIPTSGDEGAQAVRTLEPGEPLTHVIEGASTDAVLRSMDRSLPRVENALDVIHDVMVDGRKLITGPTIEQVMQAEAWLASNKIESPLATAQQAMVRLDEVTTRGANATQGLPGEVQRSLDLIDRRLADARAGITDGKVAVLSSLRRAREAVGDIDPQLDQVNQYMAAINGGEGDDWKGSLGRLVTGDDLGADLHDATESGREAIGSFNRFKSWLGMRLEYNSHAQTARIYATAEIRARTDKFYLLEFEKGPDGGVPGDQLTDAAGTTAYTRQQTIRDSLRFTAQFGKQIGPFAIRGGVKESTFGFGVDMLLLNGRLKLSNDVFGGFQRTPRVKVAAALAVFRSIYLIAGVDDVLNDPSYLPIDSGPGRQVPQLFDEIRQGRDWFVGGALHFDDADLSTLLRVYGAVLVGALTF